MERAQTIFTYYPLDISKNLRNVCVWGGGGAVAESNS